MITGQGQVICPVSNTTEFWLEHNESRIGGLERPGSAFYE